MADIARRPRPPDPPREDDVDTQEEHQDLVCVRCMAPPAQVVINRATGQQIHMTIERTAHGPATCGGLVVPRGQEWLHAFGPGAVTACLPRAGGTDAHLVRLGNPVPSGSGQWYGTPLCGKQRQGRNRSWRPILPSKVATFDLCLVCRDVPQDDAKAVSILAGGP